MMPVPLFIFGSFYLIDHTAAAEISFPTTMEIDLPRHEEDEEALVMASESARDF